MKLATNNYLIVYEKSEKNKVLLEGNLKTIQTSWFWLKSNSYKFWLLTSKTLEVYKKKSDDHPEYYICFDCSEVKVNSSASGSLIDISNDNFELSLQAETPRKANEWREQIDKSIQEGSGIKLHRWFSEGYYKVPHFTLGKNLLEQNI